MTNKPAVSREVKPAAHTPGRPLFCDAASENYGATIKIKWLRFDQKERRVYAWESYDSALIAAAPELLAALKTALDRWGKLEGSAEIGVYRTGEKTGDIIRSAIAKAEGKEGR